MFFLSMFIISPAALGEEGLKRSLEELNIFLTSPRAEADCDNEASCPAVIKHSYKDMYRTGTVGLVNKFVSDGSLRNPRVVCQSSAKEVLKIDMRKLRDQMNREFPHSIKLYEYTQGCEKVSAQEKGDELLQEAYMHYDFNYKNEAIKNTLIDLLNAEAQINLILPTERSLCSEMRIGDVRKYCENLRACKKERKSSEYMELKTKELSGALLAIQELKKQKKNQPSKSKEIDADIERIRDFNPILKSEEFRDLVKMTSPPSKNAIQSALTSQLKSSRSQIAMRLKAFNWAHDCLTGKRNNCRDFDEIMRVTRYQQNQTTFAKSRELNQVASFHQCVEGIKEDRYKADLVLNDAAINLALTLTPYAVLSGAKIAGSMARTTKVANDILKVQNVAGKAALAANLGYGAYHTEKDFEKCKTSLSVISKLAGSSSKFTCESVDKVFVYNMHGSQCVTKAAVSAALLVPIAAGSVKVAGRLPKVIPSKVTQLVNKIRGGKSLTKAEETLLLQKLKEKNPLDKLLNKGLSANDKNFAKVTLEKLYKKGDVSPEDLLKLSKMVKQTDPPLIIISRQNDVKKILESKRIWGSTEGSTYGVAKPIETKWDKIKTGVHGEKEGTFIFTPEAAALFKKHEFEGLYSGMKRAAGQYKGPFGDIIIEESKQVMVNGRPHIIVTKARRALGSPMELRHVQTTTRANARLWGRRLGIEPVVGLSASAGALQMYSWYTGKPIGDIVVEAFKEE